MVLDEFVEIANLLEIYSSLLSEKQKEYWQLEMKPKKCSEKLLIQ